MDTSMRAGLRLWPGLVLVALMWFFKLGLPLLSDEAHMVSVLGTLACVLLFFVWWLFFSRVPWKERLLIFAATVAVMAATWALSDISIRTGAMGMLFFMLATPIVCLALAFAFAMGRSRQTAAMAAVVLACAPWLLLRTNGFSGDFDNDFDWRWAPTVEDKIAAQPLPPPPPAAAAQPALTPPAEAEPEAPAPVAPKPPRPAGNIQWAGFRGANRDGIVSAPPIQTDWAAAAPARLWERAIGPGWSSFAAQDGLLYTQEQRGEEELVSAYRIQTGEPVWVHRDKTRFWESNAGPGPRGTPMLGNGLVYTLGATGIVNALDARTGASVWNHNPAVDLKVKTPEWGFSGSPLLVGDTVIVSVSGTLVAYDAESGAQRWKSDGHGESYSSPHLLQRAGGPQVLQLTTQGLFGVSPMDGKVLWQHPWKGVPIVQPSLTDGDVLISVNMDSGLRRLGLKQSGGAWSAEERWTSRGLKPYFSDFVVHEGHAYGFDGPILSCIDLKDGSRKWKGGRYGHGQLVLLREQDLLLVLAEEGDLALVKASPDGGFTEVGRTKGIEGKTWNHPVVVGDVLLVRNGEQMAAFRLGAAQVSTARAEVRNVRSAP